MKKQLSFALLTLSIVSLNILPAQAADKKTSANPLQNSSKVASENQWCVQVPWMGFFCWDL